MGIGVYGINTSGQPDHLLLDTPWINILSLVNVQSYRLLGTLWLDVSRVDKCLLGRMDTRGRNTLPKCSRTSNGKSLEDRRVGNRQDPSRRCKKTTTCTRCGREYPWTHQSSLSPEEYLTRWCDSCAREIWQRMNSVTARRFYREIARTSPFWRRMSLFPEEILMQHNQYGKSWSQAIRYACALFRKWPSKKSRHRD
jgi:hypothetical protein